MKKVFTFIMIIGICSLFAFSTSSCTRHFTCQCIMTYSGAPGLPDSTVREYDIRDTKSNADNLCKDASGTYQEGNIVTHEDCQLW